MRRKPDAVARRRQPDWARRGVVALWLWRNRQWIAIGAVVAVAVLLIILRRLDAVTNAQFWAEDGKLWFANVYNHGLLQTLAVPQGGYFQTFPNLVAGLAQLVPLRWAPHLYNTIGIAVQVLPVLLLLSKRIREVIPARRYRIGLIAAYLLLPGGFESHINITNAQWHLALAAFLVLLLKPTDNRWWRTGEISILLLSGLTGPFCAFLTPLAVTWWYFNRSKTAKSNALILLGCAAVQAVGWLWLAHLPTELEVFDRIAPPLGATPQLFFELLGQKLLLLPMFGLNVLQAVIPSAMTQVLAGGVAIGFYGYLLWKAPLSLKLFITFGLLIVASSLFFPIDSQATTPAWESAVQPLYAHRYYVPITIAFFAGLFWLLNPKQPQYVRTGAVIALLISIGGGIIGDFRHPAYRPSTFKAQTEEFAQLPEGTTYRFFLNPAPEANGWYMELRR